jgi:uncharacterized protein (DUF2147 family)
MKDNYWGGLTQAMVASIRITVSNPGIYGRDVVRNMMKNTAAIILFSILFCAAVARAANDDDILGVWNNEEKDGRIEIFKCGGKYCGKIVWAKEPNYPTGSTEGAPGTPRLDHKNPDHAKRSRPILGLQIVNDFSFAGENEWKGGTVYDPKSGNTYRGKLTLIPPNRLELRGFIGIPLFGRTTTWTR